MLHVLIPRLFVVQVAFQLLDLLSKFLVLFSLSGFSVLGISELSSELFDVILVLIDLCLVLFVQCKLLKLLLNIGKHLSLLIVLWLAPSSFVLVDLVEKRLRVLDFDLVRLE